MMSEAYGGTTDEYILILQYANEYSGDVFDFNKFVEFVSSMTSPFPYALSSSELVLDGDE